jgi:hypothetical protein
MNKCKGWAWMLLALMPVSAIASDESEAQSSCMENFSVSGSFGSGKTFLAAQEHEGVSYPVAFRKTVDAIRADGQTQVSPNEATGYIAAENPVSGGGGSTVPLRVTVRRQTDGSIRVEARFTIKGGQMTSKKKVAEGLCKIVNAASL